MTALLPQDQASSPSTWRAWLLLVVIAPVLLLAVTFAVICWIVARAGGDTSVIPGQLSIWFPYIAMINHTLLFLITVGFARADGLTLGQLGWKQAPKSWPVEIGIGLLAGVAIFFLQTSVAEPLVTAMRTSLEAAVLRPASTPVLTVSISGLIAGTFFAGVVEETVYRGYIQRQLSSRLGTIAGVAITTFGFAVGLHWGLGPWSLLVVFFTGLWLALLFEWRRNLLPCAIAHAVVNALVVIF